MEFRSVDQLNRDIAAWALLLPRDIDLVVGIPRSGLLAATLLALHLQLPLADLDGLLAGRTLGVGKRMGGLGGVDVVARSRRILVVDDSTNRGGAIREAKARVADVPALQGKVIWGAPYVAPGAGAGLVDYWYEQVAQPRAFEWNILHHSGLVNACLVIDGLIYRDDEGSQDDEAIGVDDPDAKVFRLDVRPQLIPAVEVGWLITAVAERHRPQAQAWLAAHGVRYRSLMMRPDGEVGGAADEGPAAYKAAVYQSTRAWLLIEDDAADAVTIADRCARPVYCSSRRAMVYPGVPIGDRPRARDTDAWRQAEAVRIQRKRASAWRRRMHTLWRSKGRVGG